MSNWKYNQCQSRIDHEADRLDISFQKNCINHCRKRPRGWWTKGYLGRRKSRAREIRVGTGLVVGPPTRDYSAVMTVVDTASTDRVWPVLTSISTAANSTLSMPLPINRVTGHNPPSLGQTPSLTRSDKTSPRSKPPSYAKIALRAILAWLVYRAARSSPILGPCGPSESCCDSVSSIIRLLL